MNYYQHHIGDYRRDTAHLSLLEHGVYRQLLDWYYLSEQPIPTETKEVMRRLCARTEEEKNAVEVVLKEFFYDELGWHHNRCDREISDYQAKASRARDNGKLGGRPLKTKVVISGLSKETEEKANHKPITINHKPITKDQNIDASQAIVDQKKIRKRRLPVDFLLTDEIRVSACDYWAKHNRPDISPDEQFEIFTNHHRAKGSVMACWPSAWKTWYTNAVRFTNEKRQSNSRSGAVDDWAEAATTGERRNDWRLGVGSN